MLQLNSNCGYTTSCRTDITFDIRSERDCRLIRLNGARKEYDNQNNRPGSSPTAEELEVRS